MSMYEMPPITTVNWGERYTYLPQPCTTPVQQPHLFPTDDYMMVPPSESFWSLQEMPAITTVNWGERFDYLPQPCTEPVALESLWSSDSWHMTPHESYWQ